MDCLVAFSPTSVPGIAYGVRTHTHSAMPDLSTQDTRRRIATYGAPLQRTSTTAVLLNLGARHSGHTRKRTPAVPTVHAMIAKLATTYRRTIQPHQYRARSTSVLVPGIA
eukprot:2184336-Rhodomonas_salina.3